MFIVWPDVEKACHDVIAAFIYYLTGRSSEESFALTELD
jgi:hypothetical protein